MPAATERRKRRKSDVISAVWMMVISLLAVGSIILSASKAGSADVNAARADARAARAEVKAARAQDEAVRQREGRRVAIDFLCGYGNGVADAGRRALAGKLKGQHGPGLPQESQDDYVTILNQRLIDQVGVKGTDVLIPRGPNRGLINCDRLGVAARASHP